MALNSFDSLFKSDEDKAVNGVPVPMGINSNGDPIMVWVAELGNPKHEKCQRRFSKQLELSRKNRDAYNDIVAKMVAESILVNWQGFLDEAGQPIEPSFDNKLKMLRKYKKFMNAILEAAGDGENFSIVDSEAEAATEGN